MELARGGIVDRRGQREARAGRRVDDEHASWTEDAPVERGDDVRASGRSERDSERGERERAAETSNESWPM
jgi:hypothetical protein